MDTILLSDLERFYIIQGAELGCRTDGRASNEYRPLEIETSILSHASGSASVRIVQFTSFLVVYPFIPQGETHVLGCVKMEVGKPLSNRPDEGRIEINVECYPTATYASTDKGANEIAENLKITLRSAYRSDALDLRRLCIQSGRQCWIVYIDLLKAEAIFWTLLHLQSKQPSLMQRKNTILDVPVIFPTHSHLLDPMNSRQLTPKDTEVTTPFFSEKLLPVFVTVHKVGNSHIVDASKEEEACSLSRLSVVVYPDGCTGDMLQEGCGSCQLGTIMDMFELAKKVGMELNGALTKTLRLERELRS
ncbi:3' exoribonuclease family, domain 1 [Opisthorchis viverrini]|uniref:Ribosomal RNA-processing protein 42 n=1 Tax=Opisthorchis viverrini TaxID=6198 RepID=A0A1S8WHS7_OPIVI|nr:3' exoribonuclease family, domain 1 [Opisthorchis viverrini]